MSHNRSLPLPNPQLLRPQQQQPQIYRHPDIPESAHNTIVKHILAKNIQPSHPQWNDMYTQYVKDYYVQKQREANIPQHIQSTAAKPPQRLPLPSNPTVLQPHTAAPHNTTPYNASNIQHNNTQYSQHSNNPNIQHNNVPRNNPNISNSTNNTTNSNAPHSTVSNKPIKPSELTDVIRILNACHKHTVEYAHNEQINATQSFVSILKQSSGSMSTLQKSMMCGGKTPAQHQTTLKQLYTQYKQLQHKLHSQSTQHNNTTVPPKLSDNSQSDTVSQTSEKLSESQYSDDNNVTFLQSQSVEPTAVDTTAEQDLDLPVEQTTFLHDFNDSAIVMNDTIHKHIPRTIIKLKPEDEALQQWITTQYKQYTHIYQFIDLKHCVDIIRYICSQYNIQCYNTDLYENISIITQLYLQQIVEKLIYWAKQRHDTFTEKFADTNKVLYDPKQLITEYEQQQSTVQHDTVMSTDTTVQSTPVHYDDTFHTTQAQLEGIGSTLTTFKKQKFTHNTLSSDLLHTAPLNNMFSSTTNKRSLLSRLKQRSTQSIVQSNTTTTQQKQNNVNILDMIAYMSSNPLLCKSTRLYETYLQLAPTSIEKLLHADKKDSNETIDLLKPVT